MLVISRRHFAFMNLLVYRYQTTRTPKSYSCTISLITWASKWLLSTVLTCALLFWISKLRMLYSMEWWKCLQCNIFPVHSLGIEIVNKKLYLGKCFHSSRLDVLEISLLSYLCSYFHYMKNLGCMLSLLNGSQTLLFVNVFWLAVSFLFIAWINPKSWLLLVKRKPRLTGISIHGTPFRKKIIGFIRNLPVILATLKLEQLCSTLNFLHLFSQSYIFRVKTFAG